MSFWEYKWYHAVCKLLRLASFTSSNIFEIHSLDPFYGWAVFQDMEFLGVSFPHSSVLTISQVLSKSLGLSFWSSGLKAGTLFILLCHSLTITEPTSWPKYRELFIAEELSQFFWSKRKIPLPQSFRHLLIALSLLPQLLLWNSLGLGLKWEEEEVKWNGFSLLSLSFKINLSCSRTYSSPRWLPPGYMMPGVCWGKKVGWKTHFQFGDTLHSDFLLQSSAIINIFFIYFLSFVR